ncbi:MAG: hypothetical protein WCY93_10720 [Anaerolineaceae bacterium]
MNDLIEYYARGNVILRAYRIHDDPYGAFVEELSPEVAERVEFYTPE